MTRMNRRGFVSVLLASLASECRAQRKSDIPVVVSENASDLERLAARELSEHLQTLFPSRAFSVGVQQPEGRPCIRLGTIGSCPQFRRHIAEASLSTPDSYVVTAVRESEASVGIIAGADARGTLFGVYSLLEKLGFGFYLSYDAQPDSPKGSFSFDLWQIEDAPLMQERILFNWHNFLSGCSGWDLSDWQSWIEQGTKMRFSSIMVHAYGNNPMFSFTHNGQTKPTGFLTSSTRGRDWGNEHVNDVRRLYGGAVFRGPVYGSSAALAPNAQTVEAATSLMKQVFAFAHRHGLRVDFALDVDTYSANPQNIIATLPESARFAANRCLLPNPETFEGCAYYESQLRKLLSDYPDIDRVVLWVREIGSPWSPWRDMPVANFPDGWKQEYQKAVAKTPALQNDPQSPGLFAIGKIAKAFRACLNRMGKTDVQLALGSWEFDYLRAADALMPSEVAMLCIHQWNSLGKPGIEEAIRKVSARRKVVVIPYAQDDDGHYAGRPYTPPVGFASWLLRNRCAGFGILHWTTRPLDLYVKHLSAQVWKRTRDQSLAEACDRMAERTFGQEAKSSGGEYLARWVTEAPMFGRETTDLFIDRPLTDPEGTISRAKQRLEMLNTIAPGSLSAQGARWTTYFRGWEGFVENFYRSHAAFERAAKAWRDGDIAGARNQMGQCRPEEVLDRFANMVTHAGITAGEKGLLISMNLRWAPYIVSLRQALGLDSIRWKFSPTQDEPLAQQPGSYTFFVDRDRRLWRAWGEKETGCRARVQADGVADVGDSYVELDKALSLRLRCIMDEPLLKQRYNVRLLFHLPAQHASVVRLELQGSAQQEPVTARTRLSAEDADKSGVISATHSLAIDQGFLQVRIGPETGSSLLCGVVLDPAEGPTPPSQHAG